MSDAIDRSIAFSSTFRERRIARLKREIELLESMDASLWRKAILYAVAVIVIFVSVLGALAANLNWFGWSPFVAILFLTGLVFAGWLFWRFSLWSAVVLGFLVFLVLFSVLAGESVDIGGNDSAAGDASAKTPADRTSNSVELPHSRVFDRKKKCERVIERRKLTLAKLEKLD